MVDNSRALIFEENLRALGTQDGELAEVLAKNRPRFSAPVHCRFLEARSGDPVPALADGSNTTARPLHSLMDPRREGSRLIASLGDEDFLIFFGMGGAYPIEAALERQKTGHVLIVEFNISLLGELFCLRDLRSILADRRVKILADPAEGALERYIMGQYLPALSSSIRVLPLRPRTEKAPEEFAAAAAAVQRAIDSISADYSVQAHFGERWFKNILHNLTTAGTGGPPLPRIKKALVCAAGPSLDVQLKAITKSREKDPGKSVCLIAVDTSLPALLSAGIEPDAVVSIDCQHISYYHFISHPLSHVPLFLDLASPPLLASLAKQRIFFSSGHPLTTYLSSRWRPFPMVDTSGGNVTFAAVSLAETLGAEEIELYGADFSYPLGRTYARGTYIYPHFEIRQNRLSPLEGFFSRFLYRSPLEKKSQPNGSWYYETNTLRRYRELLETKPMRARLIPAAGLGAPVKQHPRPAGGRGAEPSRGFTNNSNTTGVLSAADFLAEYREKIRSLPPAKGLNAASYTAGLKGEDRQILVTLLPLAAALRRRDQDLKGAEIIERTRDYSIAAIDRVLAVR
jgi:hypothetical protein